MSLLSSVAIFFVIWWLCLFVVLPWGVKSPHEVRGDEATDVLSGADQGAPYQPQLVKKAIATTILAGIVFAAVYLYFGVLGLRVEDILQ
jgi:predicted secreted protein